MRFRILLCAFLLFFAGSALAGELRLLTLSDLHGAINPDRLDRGGLARIATVVKKAKKEGAAEGVPVLFLNMGDSVVYEEDPSTFKKFGGEPEFGGLSLCSVDLAVPGNHDFFLGADFLDRASTLSRFEWICSNFKRGASSSLAARFAPYKTAELGGVKVGFFALLTQAYDSADYVEGDYVEVAGAMVRRLRAEGCTVVVAMSHVGYLHDRRLAESVEGIGVICGGHTHIALKVPTVIKGIPIVHAGAYGEYLGSMLLKTDEKGALRSWEWKLIPIDASVSPDPETAAFLRPWQKSYPGLVGSAQKATGGGGCESGLGWMGTAAALTFFIVFEAGRRRRAPCHARS